MSSAVLVPGDGDCCEVELREVSSGSAVRCDRGCESRHVQVSALECHGDREVCGVDYGDYEVLVVSVVGEPDAPAVAQVGIWLATDQ